MFLKGIEILGFKSFGERVNIEFGSGLTSIVGPNGSGKSNILDAVLWVLGEQSYKNIRAKESGDVIFSGGKDKKPMNFAEVSLLIDNSDSFLQVENDEIKITRKLHSNGENEYFINGSKSRLKDIGGLFLDTGIGKSAYSVIGQGKVERIIGSSPREIKSIIEEAAGIKKFQNQKNEASKNLEKVDMELEKIILVLNEVRENRDKVEKQAGKAQEYLDLKERRDSCAKGVYICEYQAKADEMEKSKKSLEELERENTTLETDFKNTQERLDKIDSEKLELKKYIEENGNKNQELKDEIESKEKEKVRVSERTAGYKREVMLQEERQNEVSQRTLQKSKHIEELSLEEKEISQKIEDLASENSKFESEIRELEKQKEDFETAYELKKRRVMELEIERMKLVNDIENSSRRVKGSVSKINSLKEELEISEKKRKTTQDELEVSKKNREEKEKSLENLKSREVFLESEITRCSQRINKLSEIIRTSEYDEKRFSSKLQALLRMEENNEGFFKGVKEVLNSKIPGVEGVFISLVNIPQKYMKAVLAGVPGNIQDIIVSTSDVAKKAIGVLKEKKAGRASFLALDTIKAGAKKELNIKLSGIVGLASDLVETAPKYEIVARFILGNLLVVEDMDTALKIVKNSLFSGNVVTLEGELLSSRGRITGGEAGNSTATQLFERKREIKELTEKTENLKKVIGDSLSEYEKLSQELEKFEKEIDSLDLNQEELRKQLRIAQETFDDYTSKLERVEKEMRTIKLELEDEVRYNTEFENKISSSNSEKDKIATLIEEIKKEEEKDILEGQKIAGIITSKNHEFSDKKILYLNSKDRISQIAREKERENSEFEILISEKEGIISKISKLTKEILELENFELRLTKEIETRLTKYESENSEITQRKNMMEELSEEERVLFKKKQELDSFLLHKKDSIEKLQSSMERTGQDIARILETLEALEDVKEEKIEFSEIKKQKENLKNLDTALKNFQAVNLLAIEEFKELNEKYQFLNSQKEDLTKGKDVLVELIKEVDETIHKRFFKAFNAIDENFNKMCMETINNAEGKLILTNGENFDECGVEIFVKFRNKKRQSLSLLSGGEKSMVAIAFIMGIFMYKPSPFTFLDEIEAALDEKNTRKLISKLKEFTDRSQFILITHNKDTMRESESIFGVTMNKEIGISKIVPVKF